MVTQDITVQVDGSRVQAVAEFNMKEWTAPLEIELGRFIGFNEASDLWVEFMLGAANMKNTHMQIGTDSYRFEMIDKATGTFHAVHMSVNPVTGKPAFHR